ncbi:hypothetical protein HZS_7996 [Henneguya salminicola]|nr:hypothetical protein HZS_7996 [Henneguya salminicola]
MASCNLIINYLPADADEKEITEIFNKYGTVDSVKLVKNKQTSASMCYGFIVMKSDEEAKSAIDALNQMPLRGKFLRVNFAKPKEEVEKDETNTNLYIIGVGTEINEETLKSTFGKFGPIVSVRIVRNSNPNNKGIAFVKFINREDAQIALDEMNGKIFCPGACAQDLCTCVDILTIKFALPQGKNALAKRSMCPGVPGIFPFPPFYAGMPNMMPPVPASSNFATASTLPNYGYATGHMQTLVSNKLPGYFNPSMPQVMNGYSLQYPNLVYTTPSNVQYSSIAYPPLYGLPLQNGITPANLSQLAVGSHCVFVYGLTQATTEEELQSMFLPYGSISNCRVCYDTTDGKRTCKGYGFVNFYSYNDAQQAINSLNNFTYKGHILQIYSSNVILLKNSFLKLLGSIGIQKLKG